MAVQADWPAAVDILFKAGAHVPKYMAVRARYCFITALPLTLTDKGVPLLWKLSGGGTDDGLSNACGGSVRLSQVGAGDAGAQKLLAARIAGLEREAEVLGELVEGQSAAS